MITKGHVQDAAAMYLGSVINSGATGGWEFCSLETIEVIEQPGCGCLAFFLRTAPVHITWYVAVFRRPLS
jgi:hypothetical protein